MTLSDAVAGSGLSFYPMVALVLFFLVFVGIAVYVGLRRRETWDRISRLPLEDDSQTSSREKGQ
jgi:cbb3-type cytochrome oxidase subunit 3